MRSFLFIEYNKPGMEWLDREENPNMSLIHALTPEAALQEWIDGDSRYLTEDHIQDQACHMQDNDRLGTTPEEIKDNWGVEMEMYEITKDLSSLPWAWLTKIAIEATQPEVGETED